MKKKIDYAEYGGAPLLGIDGICIISHGRSNAKAIMNAIFRANESIRGRVNPHLTEELKKYSGMIKTREHAAGVAGRG